MGGRGEGVAQVKIKNKDKTKITCARSCFRRGDADARITLLSRRAVMMGRSRGNGTRGFIGGGGWDGGCSMARDALSYEGGRPAGPGLSSTSPILLYFFLFPFSFFIIFNYFFCLNGNI